MPNPNGDVMRTAEGGEKMAKGQNHIRKRDLVRRLKKYRVLYLILGAGML